MTNDDSKMNERWKTTQNVSTKWMTQNAWRIFHLRWYTQLKWWKVAVCWYIKCHFNAQMCTNYIYVHTKHRTHISRLLPSSSHGRTQKKREWIYLDVELKLVVWDIRARPQSTYNQQWNEWREKKTAKDRK